MALLRALTNSKTFHIIECNKSYNTKYLDKDRWKISLKYRTLKRDILDEADHLDECSGVSSAEKSTQTERDKGDYEGSSKKVFTVGLYMNKQRATLK